MGGAALSAVKTMPLTLTSASSAACLHTWRLYNPAPTDAGPAVVAKQPRSEQSGGKGQNRGDAPASTHGKCLAVQRTHPGSIFATATSDNGLMLAGGKDGSVVWCKASQPPSTKSTKYAKTAVSAELNRAVGEFYAASNTDRPLQLGAPIFALAVHPDQSVAAVGLADGEASFSLALIFSSETVIYLQRLTCSDTPSLLPSKRFARTIYAWEVSSHGC